MFLKTVQKVQFLSIHFEWNKKVEIFSVVVFKLEFGFLVCDFLLLFLVVF